jgi:hypothetical protein
MNHPFYLFWTRANWLFLILWITLLLLVILLSVLGYRSSEQRRRWMVQEHCRRIVDVRDSGPPHSFWHCDHQSFWQGD